MIHLCTCFHVYFFITWATCFHGLKLHIDFDKKKRVGQHFGQLFSQTRPVTLHPNQCQRDRALWPKKNWWHSVCKFRQLSSRCTLNWIKVNFRAPRQNSFFSYTKLTAHWQGCQMVHIFAYQKSLLWCVLEGNWMEHFGSYNGHLVFLWPFSILTTIWSSNSHSV
jgi:hypothetical protein